MPTERLTADNQPVLALTLAGDLLADLTPVIDGLDAATARSTTGRLLLQLARRGSNADRPIDWAAIDQARTPLDRLLAARVLIVFAQWSSAVAQLDALIDQVAQDDPALPWALQMQAIAQALANDLQGAKNILTNLLDKYEFACAANIGIILYNLGDCAAGFEMLRFFEAKSVFTTVHDYCLSLQLACGLLAPAAETSDLMAASRTLVDRVQRAVPAPRSWAPRVASPRYRVGFLMLDVGSGIGMPALVHRDTDLFCHIGIFGTRPEAVPDHRSAPGFDQLLTVHGLDDDTVIAGIAQLDLDLLVVLSNLSTLKVVKIIAAKPARRIVAYGNCFFDPGLPTLDGIILPGDLLRPGDERAFQCPVHRLGCTVATADSWDGALLDPLPAELGGGPPVIGSIAWEKKLNREWFRRIAPILAAVPQCELVLDLTINAPNAPSLCRRWALDAGIPADRVRITSGDAEATFRDRMARIWLAIDTSPLGSFLTAQQALSAGLPLLTNPGAALGSRQAAGLLKTIDMESSLVVDSDARLQQRAIELLTDRPRLEALRRELPVRVRASPLGDPALVARVFEAALLECLGV